MNNQKGKSFSKNVVGISIKHRSEITVSIGMHNKCRGIIVKDPDDSQYQYCDKCGAFCEIGEKIPDGLVISENLLSWVLGETRSMWAHEYDGNESEPSNTEWKIVSINRNKGKTGI